VVRSQHRSPGERSDPGDRSRISLRSCGLRIKTQVWWAKRSVPTISQFVR